MEFNDLKTITDEMLITRKFSTANEFSQYIESQVQSTSLSYMEAILAYCDDEDIDVESIKPLVNKSLKDKIQVEAEEKNYFVRSRKKGKLPL